LPNDFEELVEFFKQFLQGWSENEIQNLYWKGECSDVVVKTTNYFNKNELTKDNLYLAYYRADCLYGEKKDDEALKAYYFILPALKKFNNVHRRKYSDVYFHIGVLNYRKGLFKTAQEFVIEGLKHRSDTAYYQILLGEIYLARGSAKKALSHFNDLLTHFQTTKEQRIVLQIKVNRLGKNDMPKVFEVPDFSDFQFYDGFSMKIQPINQYNTDLPLEKLCLLLESKFGFKCEVMPPLLLKEEVIWDEARGQYKADVILSELETLFPDRKLNQYGVLAITGKDIFGGNTNFVFSWQNWGTKVGVISSQRFSEHLDVWYEPETLLVRRLGIQLISTTGSILKFPRPTKPYCPLAYPDSFYEFLEKDSKLCESTIKFQRIAMQPFPGSYSEPPHGKIKAFQKLYAQFHFN